MIILKTFKSKESFNGVLLTIYLQIQSTTRAISNVHMLATIITEIPRCEEDLLLTSSSVSEVFSLQLGSVV